MKFYNLMKKILFLLSLIILFGLAYSANAGSSHNVSGWAWSSGIGWISFNSTNHQSPSIDYGVHIDPDSGDMSGYAWTETIGWINFNGASYDVDTKSFSGRARACAVFENGCSGDLKPDSQRGGWDGWISLSGSNYQVSLDGSPDPAEFKGWAWGDQVVGWISFNCSNQGACGQSDYKVTTTLTTVPENNPPTAKNLNVDEITGCDDATPRVFLNWTFDDDDGDQPSGYQVQVDNNSNFSSPEVDTGEVFNDSGSYPPPGLNFATTYYWRVRVYDGENWSDDWFEGPQFTTDSRWPDPDFTWDPENPETGEEISFDNKTNYCSSCSYAWDFDDGSPIDNSSDPTHVYSIAEIYSVELTAASGSQSCSAIKDVAVDVLPLPNWREITPF